MRRRSFTLWRVGVTALACAVAMLLVPSARAATYTWDGGGAADTSFN